MPLGKTIAMRVIEKMAGKGMSGRAIIRMFQARGGAMRRIDAIDYIRQTEGRVKYQPLIEKLGFDQSVPRAWMVEADLGNQGKYRVFGKATFYDELEGKPYEQLVSFYTDDYSATGEYGMAFADHFGGIYKQEEFEFIEFTQAGLEHNKGWTY